MAGIGRWKKSSKPASSINFRGARIARLTAAQYLLITFEENPIMRRNPLKNLALVLALCLLGMNPAGADITVYAAASLSNALTEIAKRFERDQGVAVKLSFAASSALAKQIEQGAPADVYASADLKWMDYLDGKGKIDHDSRKNLLGNTLVLIAPAGAGFPVTMAKDFDFAAAFAGKLCTGVPEAVPVGMYAKEALVHLGWWEKMQYRVVGAEDVRAALNLVERGECEAGIVYATDAQQSRKIEKIASFPAATHGPIVYPFALVTQSGEAKAFLRYLENPAAQAVFSAHGFKPLP
jgi:molybdate transport system substrate-binding protein